MRTTVTIDPDTEFLLKQEVQRSGQSFKVVLNKSIRQALAPQAKAMVQITPLFQHPFPTELNTTNLNHLADQLDDDETLQELAR